MRSYFLLYALSQISTFTMLRWRTITDMRTKIKKDYNW
jgi:hypothetical protein